MKGNVKKGFVFGEESSVRYMTVQQGLWCVLPGVTVVFVMVGSVELGVDACGDSVVAEGCYARRFFTRLMLRPLNCVSGWSSPSIF